MFSGIVECMGSITHLVANQGCKEFTISPGLPFDDLQIGDSIAINGVCLTITSFNQHSFSLTAVPETLRKTNLQNLKLGSQVNLERALKTNARIGGHYMQGHVDAVGEILALEKDHSAALLVKISLPAELNKYVIPKGYIGLDGMSITIIETTPHWFTVTFIPHTQQYTITHQYTVGSFINLEMDAMGKYVEKLIGAYQHAVTH